MKKPILVTRRFMITPGKQAIKALRDEIDKYDHSAWREVADAIFRDGCRARGYYINEAASTDVEQQPEIDQGEWVEIPGFESYRVTRNGRIGSTLKQICKHGDCVWTRTKEVQKILSPSLAGGYYPSVSLSANGKRVTRRVHQLVALTFLGKCPDGLEVCHNDGDSTNNSIENLRYDTRRNNILDCHNGVDTREEVYKFVVKYQRRNVGVSPSIGEIAAAVGKGASTVVHHIREDPRLTRRGPRWIEVAQEDEGCREN